MSCDCLKLIGERVIEYNNWKGGHLIWVDKNMLGKGQFMLKVEYIVEGKKRKLKCNVGTTFCGFCGVEL